jgi:4'-phosphopantetheinyl transferase
MGLRSLIRERRTKVETMMLGETNYLPDDEVHIWVVDLDRPPHGKQILSHDEQKRADRFAKPDDRRRFRVAHASLRCILGRYLNEAPLSLVFDVNRVGKPFLQAPGRPQRIAFNLAHSERHGLIAVACNREVGVDVEVERNLDDLCGIAQQIMSSSELQDFRLTACHHAIAAFFGLWTRKEALLKATGTGFSIDPRSVNLGLENGQAAVIIGGSTWSVAPLGALLPLKAAIAVNGDLPAIRIFDWDSRPLSTAQ